MKILSNINVLSVISHLVIYNLVKVNCQNSHIVDSCQ